MSANAADGEPAPTEDDGMEEAVAPTVSDDDGAGETILSPPGWQDMSDVGGSVQVFFVQHPPDFKHKDAILCGVRGACQTAVATLILSGCFYFASGCPTTCLSTRFKKKRRLRFDCS
jgi:hypothetical protein